MAAEASRSRAFFLELILDLVVFALCAIVAVQVFLGAEMTKEKSSALSHLSIEAQAYAETFKACDGDMDAMIATFLRTQTVSGAVIETPSSMVSYYDASFEPTQDSEGARYRVQCVIDATRDLKTAQITLFDRESELYQFDVKDYTPKAERQGGSEQ